MKIAEFVRHAWDDSENNPLFVRNLQGLHFTLVNTHTQKEIVRRIEAIFRPQGLIRLEDGNQGSGSVTEQSSEAGGENVFRDEAMELAALKSPFAN